VRTAREVLDNCEGKPVLEELEHAWKLLELEYGTIEVFGREQKVVDRASIETFADNRLAALMFSIDCGFYPPPELLMGLWFLWDEYLDAGGSKTLEEVFIGKPKRKVGNYAGQRSNSSNAMYYVLSVQSSSIPDDAHPVRGAARHRAA